MQNFRLLKHNDVKIVKYEDFRVLKRDDYRKTNHLFLTKSSLSNCFIIISLELSSFNLSKKYWIINKIVLLLVTII